MTISTEELVGRLAEPLRERVRVVCRQPPKYTGEFVLYWMRTAVRADENPALDVAIEFGNQLRVPVFIYHALSERYSYASDRHHTFILEGARDVQAAFDAMNLGYAFHLERRGSRGPHLRTLSERAAVVITEDMPVEPLRRWTQSLSRGLDRPLVAVDTACIVPMQIVGRASERTFAYRKATSKLYEQRLTRVPHAVAAEVDARVPDELPFQTVDLQTADIAELVSECDIDHAIGPVPHTFGGSTAGYQRWDSFRSPNKTALWPVSRPSH